MVRQVVETHACEQALLSEHQGQKDSGNVDCLVWPFSRTFTHILLVGCVVIIFLDQLRKKGSKTDRRVSERVMVQKV